MTLALQNMRQHFACFVTEINSVQSSAAQMPVTRKSPSDTKRANKKLSNTPGSLYF